MRRKSGLGTMIALTALTLTLAVPAGANVREGVDAWSRGDYAAAVAQWQAPAEAGDADAMFNLGQAYRLGRGVPIDPARAEDLYARAAAAGHVPAADTYGLMLFQSGRREQALPYVEGAARRGDPRAQYLLGIAHYNGDLVPRDWQRAYALLTLANASGLPPAAAALAQMDETIPLAERQQAAALARELENDAIRAREVELASADLGTTATTDGGGAASPRIPRPIPTTGVSPSVAAARAAVDEARRASGTESPSAAGASYAARPPVQVAAAPPPAPRPTARPAAAPARTPAPAPAPAAASGPWRVQLGAFSVRGNAEALWNRLAGRAELAGRERLLIPAGRVTKLQAGGFATQAAAQAACRTLSAAGHACLVTRN